jgi:adenylate cyclase
MVQQFDPSSEADAFWRKVLIEGHQPLRLMQRLFRYLPGPPRCKLCHNPFGGFGGKLVGLFGFTPSRKNPNICAACCEMLPQGGAEVDIAVLFADVRGSTAIGERLQPSAYASLLNRFYRAATEVLIRQDAIIDKLMGDEVMALFIPGVCGPHYQQRGFEAARALFEAVGYGQDAAEPWMPIGGAVASGLTYVGNVGGENVLDFTALGDTVNTASRLASAAAAGEILVTQSIHEKIGPTITVETRVLSLRGKEAPLEVLAFRYAAPRSASIKNVSIC